MTQSRFIVVVDGYLKTRDDGEAWTAALADEFMLAVTMVSNH
jgi:hypothetical protein